MAAGERPECCMGHCSGDAPLGARMRPLASPLNSASMQQCAAVAAGRLVAPTARSSSSVEPSWAPSARPARPPPRHRQPWRQCRAAERDDAGAWRQAAGGSGGGSARPSALALLPDEALQVMMDAVHRLIAHRVCSHSCRTCAQAPDTVHVVALSSSRLKPSLPPFPSAGVRRASGAVPAAAAAPDRVSEAQPAGRAVLLGAGVCERQHGR